MSGRVLFYAVAIGLTVVLVPLLMGDPGRDLAYALSPIVSVILVVLFVVWIISAGVRTGMRGARQDADRESNVPRGRGFSVKTDGPGRYKVRGVDKASGMDTSWQCEADSAGNAKVKGELKGIIVTSVDYVGP